MTIEQRDVRALQAQQLTANAPLGMAATVVNSLLLTVVLWQSVPRHRLVLWTSALLLLTLIRLVQALRYRRSPEDGDEAGRRIRSFTIGMAVSGLVWGSAGLLLFPAGSLPHQVFIAFVLGGMVAGAAGTFSAVRSAFFAFALPALAPLIIRFLAIGDEFHLAMGVMTALFLGLLAAVSKRVHDAFLLSLKLTAENSGLLNSLSSSKDRAERLNEELRTENAERARAEGLLQQHQSNLEELVRTRTAELSEANRQLQQEMTARTVETELRRQHEAHFRSLIDNSLDLITVLDRNGSILFKSPSVERLLGCRREELIGSDFFGLVHADDLAAARAVFDRLVQAPGSTASIELRLRHQQHDWRYFEVKGKSIIDDAQSVHVILNSRDSTERRDRQAEMLRVQKLESLGVLAGGIAHDFNNLLTGIMTNLELAKGRAAGDRDLLGLLAAADQASRRAHDLTLQFLTFSRGGEPVKSVVPIDGLLRDSARFALRGSKASCTFDIPGDLLMVNVDPGQLRQAVQNIVINADQAMPGGGTIHIAGANVTIGPDSALALPTGSYVRISITDQGAGIPAEDLTRIFDPFFTTRPGRSGLGLTAAHSIVGKHQGTIQVESRVGAGTTVNIYFPAVADTARAKPAVPAGVVPGTGRVLIMDDEEVIRDSVGKILQMAGYAVETAVDGREAIERYRKAAEEGRPFSGVIMDLTIPGGMGGKEAVRKLLAFDPDARVIVSSGYSDDPIMAQYREHGFLGVIAKPYRIRELTEAVRNVIVRDR